MVTHVLIDGMRSVHCIRAVFTGLAGVDGIAGAEVRMGEAVVTHDGRATAEALRRAVADAGYTVREVREERRRLV